MADSFQFDDIFSAPPSSNSGVKRLSGGLKSNSINWGALFEPSPASSSPDKKLRTNTANKAMVAINQVSELASPSSMPVSIPEEKDRDIDRIQHNGDTAVNGSIDLDERRLARIGHMAVFINGKMYVHGGECDVPDKGTLGDLLVYDVATGTLSSSLCESPSRAWHTGTYLPNSNLLLIFGGERTVGTDEPNAYIDEPLVLDTSINLWYPPSISGKSPGARSGHTATLINDNILVFLCGRRFYFDLLPLFNATIFLISYNFYSTEAVNGVIVCSI